MIDTDKYEGHTGPWKPHTIQPLYGNMVLFGFNEQDSMLSADAPLLLAEVKRLRVGIRGILSDYDITELIRDVPKDEWNFEQQALVRMKEMIE